MSKCKTHVCDAQQQPNFVIMCPKSPRWAPVVLAHKPGWSPRSYYQQLAPCTTLTPVLPGVFLPKVILRPRLMPFLRPKAAGIFSGQRFCPSSGGQPQSLREKKFIENSARVRSDTFFLSELFFAQNGNCQSQKRKLSEPGPEIVRDTFFSP